jgi:hypothetical protein
MYKPNEKKSGVVPSRMDLVPGVHKIGLTSCRHGVVHGLELPENMLQNFLLE